MSIIGAAMLPHTPLLLPTTDPAHAQRLEKIARACKTVAEWVHALQPDIILCINPHTPTNAKQFTFNLAKQYFGAFEEFGDLSTTIDVPAAPKFAYHLKEHVEAHAHVAASHETHVTYGLSIPALLLKDCKPQPRWVELSTTTQPPSEHIHFGSLLHGELLNARERILILASGEIAARCSAESPSGVSANAQTFWKDWTNAMKARRLQHFLESVPLETVQDVLSCGTLSVSLLAGCTRSLGLEPTVHVNAVLYGTAYSVVSWQPV